MSELHNFIKKQTSHFSDISCRKLYGLDSFYLKDSPFILISSDDRVVIKVEDFEVKKKILEIPQATQWKLNDKVMENWFVLPDTFNKKKNKIAPILKMTESVLLNPKNPKKEKKKHKKNHKKKCKGKSGLQSKPKKTANNSPKITEEKFSFFKKIFKIK